MTRINLAGADERIKDVFRQAALDPIGTLVDVDGQTRVWVVPANSENGDASPWTEEKNQRRCDLIDQKYSKGLNVIEAVELARLQDEMLRYRQRIAPLPLEELRLLHEELLRKAAHAKKEP